MPIQLPELIEIRDSGKGGKGLFARSPIGKCSIIFHFEGRIGDDAHTNDESLQIDDDTFLESTMKFDDFLNHSCEPNCFIDFATLNLVALRDIGEQEELTFNYNTSEYDAVNLIKDHSFKCRCGSENCTGEFKGFRWLSFEQKNEIRGFLSPFVKKKFGQE